MCARITIGRAARAARGALAAGLVGAGMMMVPAPEASAQLSCTAALDVDVHYCLDDADIGFYGMLNLYVEF